MPLIVGWPEVAWRLGTAVFAALLIGLNRGEHGRAAGIRTTILVCLSACLSMVLANVLLATSGKAPDSFVQLDFMRLPLGILSGMGFIGAGTILRKGSLIEGVTTAATLWLVTMLGLCFGAGQIILGFAGTTLGLIALWALKYCELFMRKDRRGTMTLKLSPDNFSDDELRRAIVQSRCKVISWGLSVGKDHSVRQIICEIEWRTSSAASSFPPNVVARLAADPRVQSLCWIPQGLSSVETEK
jgi:putative Mg2+ transporter-C (MgtC) family protein